MSVWLILGLFLQRDVLLLLSRTLFYQVQPVQTVYLELLNALLLFYLNGFWKTSIYHIIINFSNPTYTRYLFGYHHLLNFSAIFLFRILEINVMLPQKKSFPASVGQVLSLSFIFIFMTISEPAALIAGSEELLFE